MNYVIAGCRHFTDEKWIESELRGFLAVDDLVVTGGAKGVDSIAYEYAFRMFCEVQVIEADWDKHGRAAGPIRNGLMLDRVGPYGILIAFWDGKSRGTGNIIGQAKERLIETHIFYRK